MKKIYFKFAETKYELEPQDYSWDEEVTLTTGETTTMCFVGISMLDDSAPYILGDVFLRKFATSYDFTNK